MTYDELIGQIVDGVVTDVFQVWEDDYSRLDQIKEDIERFITYVFEGDVPPVSKQSLQVIYDKLLEDYRPVYYSQSDKKAEEQKEEEIIDYLLSTNVVTSSEGGEDKLTDLFS